MMISRLASLYPGDDVVMFLLVSAIAVASISGMSLLVALQLGRCPALRHDVLLAGLICTGLIPIFTILTGFTPYSLVQVNLPLPFLAEPPSRIFNATKSEFRSSTNEISDRTAGDADIRPEAPSEVQRPLTVSEITETVAAKAKTPLAIRRPIWFCVAATIVCLIWAVGSLVLLIRYLIASIQVEVIRRGIRPLRQNVHQPACEQVMRVMNLRRLPEICVSQDVKTPVVTGLLRPQIVLPQSLLNTLSDGELQEILIHETAHTMRRDLWVVQFEAFIMIMTWPIPLVSLLICELSRAREELCDIHVLKTHERHDYGRTLLRIARITDSNRPIPLATGILHGPGQLESRVASLLNSDRDESTKLSWLLTTGILVVFLLLTCAVCGTRLMANNGFEDGGQEKPSAKPTAADDVAESSNNPAAVPTKQKQDVDGVRLNQFVPTLGFQNKTSWTEFKSVPNTKVTGLEQMTAQLTLGGAVPVGENDQGKPLFELVLFAGSTGSLNVILCDSAGRNIYELLYRDEPVAWQFANILWKLTYVATPVDDDKTTKSQIASVIITRQPSEGEDQSPANPVARIRQSVAEYANNVRLTAAPIVAAMIAEHGYGLAEGQSLARVAPPFPDLRTSYYFVVLPSWRNPYQTASASMGSMKLEWDNNAFQWKKTGSHSQSLKWLPNFLFDWNTQYTDGDKTLLDHVVPGDWIVRNGSSAEEVLADLETILVEQLSMPVHFEIREVPRKVYVAKGKYKHHSLPDRDAKIVSDLLRNNDHASLNGQLFVFPKELVPRNGAYFENGSLDKLLLDAGNWISMPIVNEVETPPDGQLCWRGHTGSKVSKRDFGPMPKPTYDTEDILDQLSQQTGLHFIEGIRPVKILFVEEAKLK